MENNNYTVRTLSDNVAEKDELGSHQNIANKISELIETEEDGNAIALTGMWGSGKSSVIEMMKKRLGSSTSIFVYDAWAHDRDPLKRSFLENLIDHLADRWIDKKKWDEYKEELAKRKETTDITNYSELTLFGIFLSFTAVLVPIGLIVLNQACWKHFNWLLFIGFLLSLSPIILGFGKFFLNIKKIRNHEDRKKDFALLTGESTKKIKSDTYRTPDPTSIEFHQKYKEILSEGLSGNQNKLVIVVDNLDRLDKDTALSMWSTMKTFLEFSKLSDEDWSNRLWLIVPFDPKSMMRLWNHDKKTDDEDVVDNGEHGDLASSFIEKTFQLTFHVPLPVLSNWIEYFKKQFRWAFPSIKDEEVIHKVYRIFRLKKFRGSAIPTPREIKIYINRMATIYSIWHKDIPINHIALYVSIESDGHLDMKYLQNREAIADSLSEELIGTDFQVSLASIYFNVEKENALHILLGKDLENAILSRNSTQVTKMSTGIGYDKVLEEVVDDNANDWSKESPSIIAWLVNNLSENSETDGSSLKRIWYKLGNSAHSIESWKIINAETGAGISKLVDYKKSEDFSHSILKSISNTEISKEEDIDEIDIDIVNDWVRGCLIVLDKISELHNDKMIDEHFSCPGDAATYYSILKVAAKSSKSSHMLSKLFPQAKPEEIFKILTKVITDGKYNNDTHNIVKLLRTINVGWNWDILLATISTRVKAPNDIELRELEQLLSTLIEFDDDLENAQKALKTISTNGDCLHHLHKAFSSKDSLVTSICLFVLLKYNPSGTVSTPVGDSPTGSQYYNNILAKPDQIDFAIEDLSKLFKDNSNIEMLFNELKNNNTIQEIRYSILINLCTDKNLTNLITVETLINNETDFFNALDDEEYQSVVDQYIDKAELIKEIKKLSFKPILASLYGAIIKSSNSDTNDIQSFILNGLQNLQKDDWVEEFSADYFNLFDLLILLNKNGIQANLKTLYREALNEYKKLVITGSEPKVNLSKDWIIFINALEDNLRKSYLDQIIDEVIESKDDAGTIIDLFGKSLIDSEKLSNKKDVLVNKFVHVFYEQKQMEKLNWFSDIVELHPEIITKSSKASRASLEDLLKTKLKDEKLEPEMRTVMEKIGLSIGLKPDKTDSIGNDQEDETIL